MDAMTKVAEIYSKTFTPFSVAAIVSVVFSWFSPEGIGPSMTPLSSATIGILTLCVAPFLPVAYNATIGRTDLDVSDVKKRAPLYVLGLFGYATGAAIYSSLNNRIMFVMAVAYLCVSFTMLTITLGWKISAHTAGIAGPTTALVFVFGAQVLLLYGLSILMIWGRVRLGSHTLSQALAGAVVAIVVTSLVFFSMYSSLPNWLWAVE
jgi:membrane-associated phospholipid phosphatase